MKKFDVTFYITDEDYYEKTFEYNDINSLIKFINEQRYIHILGNIHDIKLKKWKSHTVIYMLDSVARLGIDEILVENNSSFMESIDSKI